MFDVSVCIATYRRPRGLARLLESLMRQKLPPGLRVEIVVVDNDASGSATNVADARGLGPHPVRYFVEPRRNIAHARNCALRQALGRWIAFIDDDEIAEEGWLAAYWSICERFDADGFCGPVLPRLERPASSWLDLEAFYARPRFADAHELGLSDLRTSNAFVRRASIARRRFDPAFGRTGGSDVELFGRMLRAGAHFRWCDEARVVEFVPPERHRLTWLVKRAFRGGCVFTRMATRGRSPRYAARSLARALTALAALSAALPFAALGGRRPAARVWLRMCVQLGHLWSLAGRSYREYA